MAEDDAIAATTAVAATVSAKHPLASPTTSALKAIDGKVSSTEPQSGYMERTMSEDIREQREDLKEAAEKNLNIIVDLALDGRIRWVSDSWGDVLGSDATIVPGSSISNILVDDVDLFTDAIACMQKDDSRSKIIRFRARVGPRSILKPDSLVPVTEIEKRDDSESVEEVLQADARKAAQGPAVQTVPTLNLEAQGIMVYDRASGGDSHVSNSSADPPIGSTDFNFLRRRCG